MIIQMLKDNPRAMIAVQRDFSSEMVLETLEEQGYTVTKIPMYISGEVDAPEPPETVDPDAYEDEEESRTTKAKRRISRPITRISNTPSRRDESANTP
ncbi:hypothetical protein [Alistipes onderdonkii]|uniref:hypothetical protein n=1 Tax=Alistipes onderdonkii TaxID=328813 RepID=UPI0018752F69|nr:hypothetical protein [Alistipes onderdonkii]MBE5047944.1 hypothetical protein [Alistipes onderdonkii]